MNRSRKTKSARSPWVNLGLTQKTVSLLERAGFEEPTPIQKEAIPAALKGRDLIASARTGSGKTAGFSLPMIERFRDRRGTYGLVLCPTREIANQTQKTFIDFGHPQGVTSAVLIGGVDYSQDVRALRSGPSVLVGTPGRICDHLERGNLWLEYIEMLVLDEADRMLDMGFAKELNRITREISRNRQTLLFSATIPPAIERLGDQLLKKPQRIQIGESLTASHTVDHRLSWVDERSKVRALMALLKKERGSVIVFSRTKTSTYDLWRSAVDHGFKDATYISSNKQQSDREKALKDFQEGRSRILFATDVAGRGIHVENVAHVINFDLPKEPEDYIHRIGRTGRKNASGKATSLVTSRDRRQVSAIERVLKKPIPDVQERQDDRPKRKPKTQSKSSRSRSTEKRTSRQSHREKSREDSRPRGRSSSRSEGRSTRSRSEERPRRAAKSSSRRTRSSERHEEDYRSRSTSERSPRKKPKSSRRSARQGGSDERQPRRRSEGREYERSERPRRSQSRSQESRRSETSSSRPKRSSRRPEKSSSSRSTRSGQPRPSSRRSPRHEEGSRRTSNRGRNTGRRPNERRSQKPKDPIPPPDTYGRAMTREDLFDSPLTNHTLTQSQPTGRGRSQRNAQGNRERSGNRNSRQNSSSRRSRQGQSSSRGTNRGSRTKPRSGGPRKRPTRRRD